MEVGKKKELISFLLTQFSSGGFIIVVDVYLV